MSGFTAGRATMSQRQRPHRYLNVMRATNTAPPRPSKSSESVPRPSHSITPRVARTSLVFPFLCNAASCDHYMPNSRYSAVSPYPTAGNDATDAFQYAPATCTTILSNCTTPELVPGPTTQTFTHPNTAYPPLQPTVSNHRQPITLSFTGQSFMHLNAGLQTSLSPKRGSPSAPLAEPHIKTNPTDSYTILLFNSRAINKKMHLLAPLILLSSPLVVMVTETWHAADMPDPPLHIPGFKTFCNGRINQRGGGCLIYVSNEFHAASFQTILPGTPEASVWIQATGGQVNILIGCMHNPPHLTSTSADELDKLFHEVSFLPARHKIIGGDFNSPTSRGLLNQHHPGIGPS
ncbi:unnamed protein product [Dicrocoelium dendriticum]|nr:unnamed protein product [Dicrocoelium dendriticum]